MKWYFASRIRHKEKLIDICLFLESRGETINSKWIYEGSLKPYDQNIPKAETFSSEVVKAILDSDVFVLISDSGGTDMFIELGVILAKSYSTNKPRIYIVGEYSRRSLMQLHPAIIHAANFQKVFTAEQIESDGFSLPDFT